MGRARALIAAALAAAALLLGGCDAFRSREVKDCEDTLLHKLKAPSTYKLIEQSTTYMRLEHPPEVWVSLEYDAQNSYGALLRDTEICRYPATGSGQVDWPRIDRDRETAADAALAVAEAASDSLNTAAAGAPLATDTEAYPGEDTRVDAVDSDAVDATDAPIGQSASGTTDPDGGE